MLPPLLIEIKTIYNQAVKGIQTVQKTLHSVGESAKVMTKQFDYTFLTFLFAGMMMQRVFGGFLRSIFNVYQKVAEYNTPLTQSIMGVQASFEYLKWSIFNALSQTPLFMTLIDLIQSLSDWISDTISKHPAIASVTVMIASIGWLVGAGLVATGFFIQIGMALASSMGGVLTGGKVAWMGFLKGGMYGIAAMASLVLLIDSVSKIISAVKSGDYDKIKEAIGELLLSAAPWITMWNPYAGILTASIGLSLVFGDVLTESKIGKALDFINKPFTLRIWDIGKSIYDAMKKPTEDVKNEFESINQTIGAIDVKGTIISNVNTIKEGTEGIYARNLLIEGSYDAQLEKQAAQIDNNSALIAQNETMISQQERLASARARSIRNVTSVVTS